MGVKISALPSIISPTLADVFPVSSDGVTYKETCTQLAALIGASIAPNVVGTANQIIVTPGVGNVTLSTPQNIAATSDVTFGSIAFNPTTKGIVGTAVADNAASGYVGEFITSNIPFASQTSLADSTAKNITSITVSAGDWDIFGNVGFYPNTNTVVTNVSCWTSTTSATLPDTSLLSGVAYNSAAGTWGGGAATSVQASFLRVNVNAPTIVYLTAFAVFSVSTLTAAGSIFARRVR